MELRPVIPPALSEADPDWSEKLIDALHSVVADKLEQNPRLLGIAVNNLSIWRRQARDQRRPGEVERRQGPDRQQLIRQWKLIVFTWQFPEILDFLRHPRPEARPLLRMSPFCGILTGEEIARACAEVTREPWARGSSARSRATTPREDVPSA